MPDNDAGAACRDLLTDFKVTVEVPVAWGEMDALGHVNNVVYFRYFETARMAYFEAVGFGDTDTGVGPILADTRCRFRAPLKYPDQIVVGARVHQVESDRFEMKYAIASQSHNRIVAEGSGLIVCYDYRNHRKTALPAEIVDAIHALEGG